LWGPDPCGRIRQVSRGGATIIRDHPDWRRYRQACPYYRERWAVDDEEGVDGNVLLYQIICLQNTPPENQAEQDRCMKSRTRCWRLARTKAHDATDQAETAAAASGRETNR
jgi:hypothetical protein